MTTETIDFDIRSAAPRSETRLELRGLDEAAAPSAGVAARALADWVRTYLMRPHADIGRAGHVCPFTARAARLSLLRIGVSPLEGHDKAGILATMRAALAAFDGLPCTRSTRIFRSVIVGFPACANASGLATLYQVQKAMRSHSIVGARMIGVFEPDSRAEGLLNPSFRPLRAPIPALAIRMLVEQDAPFVARNPLLLPIYLAKFPLAGSKRLVASGLISHLGARLAAKVGRAKPAHPEP